jgi:hypothetical protein
MEGRICVGRVGIIEGYGREVGIYRRIEEN